MASKINKLENENKFLKTIVLVNTGILTVITIILIMLFMQIKNININNNSSSSNNTNDKLEDFEFDVDNLNFVNTNGKVWNDQIFAPFVDTTLWVNSDYSLNGTLNLGKIMDEINIQYFNLGFITALHSKTISNNTIDWGFGGYDTLSEGSNSEQYNGIKQVINDVRNKGGDVCISIGGLNEGNFFQVTNDIDILTNSYLEIVDGFNLTRLDLDIEGGSLAPYVDHTNNAKAIKKLQELTNVEIVLTLPVMPEGLITSGLQTLRTYIEEGVSIKAVNIMGMCYGSSYYDKYDTGTIDAIDNTMLQIKEEYNKVNKSITTEEAYNMLSITTSIGYEGYGHPIFTTQMTTLVVEHCIKNKLNLISYWSLNRDSMTESNSGIYSKYEHALICLNK